MSNRGFISSIILMSSEGKHYGPYGKVALGNSKIFNLECFLGLDGVRNEGTGGMLGLSVITSNPPSQHTGWVTSSFSNCAPKHHEPSKGTQKECLEHCAAYSWCKAASFQDGSCFIWHSFDECTATDEASVEHINVKGEVCFKWIDSSVCLK